MSYSTCEIQCSARGAAVKSGEDYILTDGGYDGTLRRLRASLRIHFDTSLAGNQHQKET